jgi:hypothetical protein
LKVRMLFPIALLLISLVQALCCPTSVSSTSYRDSGTINLEFSFPEPTVSRKSDEYYSVEMSGLQNYGAPGEPVLPYKTAQVLIPQGKAVECISLGQTSRQVLGYGFLLEYGKTPIPVSTGEPAKDKPDPAIYRSSSPFPATPCLMSAEQHLRGYKILLLTVFPVQYLPKTGELSYYKNLHLELEMKDAGCASHFFRGLPKDEALAEHTTVNPQAVETYSTIEHDRRRSPLSEPLQSFDYVIVTSQNLSASFQPLVDWKNQKGVSATMVLVEDILENPEYFCDGAFGDGCASHFNDTAARIRNFIKDAYLNWGTDYVLLGGDTEIVPARKVYAYSEGFAASYFYVDYEIPCDMYYGALDGSWDNDNDTVFGEGQFDVGPENGTAGEEADFFAEVYIGRAPVDEAQEAANFVGKTLWYEQTSDDEYLKKALMIGETLDEETEGGNSKDSVTSWVPQYTMERLYDRDKTFGYDALVSELNSGPHIVNHVGHAYYTNMMGLSPEDVDNLNNTRFFMMYSIGCYSAAFDEVSDPDEAIAEHFIKNPTGAFAYIGNTRFGWYSPGSMNAPCDIFDKEFFRVLSQGEGNLGRILQTSKENLYRAHVHRWTYFNLVLLGDPETEIVSEIKAPTAQFDTAPNPNQLSPRVLKGIVELTGTAKRGNAAQTTFRNFTIEFGRGINPSLWYSTGIQLEDNGQLEKTNSLLATWNTSSLSPSTYTLRLTVNDLDERTGEDRWIVAVERLPTLLIQPQLVETSEGLEVTVSAKITNSEELFHLDIEIGWDSALLDYEEHVLNVPVEECPGGVLHSPVSIKADQVNQTSGTYHLKAISTSKTPFQGSGTIFSMTFLAQSEGACTLEFLSSKLYDSQGHLIPHSISKATVHIGAGVHDLALTNIDIMRTAVGHGYPAKIEVIASNEGTFTEQFYLTVYMNGTAMNTTQLVLAGLTNTSVTLRWNTSGCGFGNYTINVYIWPAEGENDTQDNSLTADKMVCITIAGDINTNRIVDILDIVLLASTYGSSEGQARFNANCDVNGNGAVDIIDVVIAAGNYRRNW